MIIVGNVYSGLGGGSSMVFTANGISGDGTIGTPVILGGNPLNQATTIDLATFELNFSSNASPSDSCNFVFGGSLWDFLLLNTGISSFEMNANNNAGVIIASDLVALSNSQLVIGTTGFQLFYTAIGGGTTRGFEGDQASAGIVVTDSLGLLGMIAQADYSANIIITPNAYTTVLAVQALIAATPVAAAGADTQVQFNNAGALGASPDLTFVSPDLTIGVPATTSGKLSLAYNGSANVPSLTTAAGSIILDPDGTGANNILFLDAESQFPNILFVGDTLRVVNKIRVTQGAQEYQITPSRLSLQQVSGTTNWDIGFNTASDYSIYNAISGNYDLYLFNATDNVGIGTNTDVPSAKFNVVSTTQGALPLPRMTSVERLAIASPANALQVFDTDLESPFYWNGSQWLATGNVSNLNAPGVAVSQSLNYVAGSTPEVVRINPWALWVSGLGNTTVILNYTDNNGAAQTLNAGVVQTGATNLNSLAAFVFGVQAGSTVNVTWALAGAGIFDALATIERLL